jgi:zinc D-Ala-D-Ala carboxypeptidase
MKSARLAQGVTEGRAMRLSQHFTLAEATHSETAKRLGISNRPDAAALDAMIDTARNMEAIRSLFGKPIRVTSWYRNPEANKAVGGSATSEHVSGRAVDFRIDGFTAMEIATRIAQSPIWFDQLILYSNRVHLGWRDPKGNFPDRRELLTRIQGGYAKGLEPDKAI